jgi:hypothetical protein
MIWIRIRLKPVRIHNTGNTYLFYFIPVIVRCYLIRLRIQEGQISVNPEPVSNPLNCSGSAGEGEKSLGGRRGSGKELLALSAGTASTPAKARWDLTPFDQDC